mmetsp:Transcript_16038/g.35894  ORF Transcript_16038/g.35894 Transcript_16038/m.35894 type:complete len:203 (+) Transcript_16038:708-1316(+)
MTHGSWSGSRTSERCVFGSTLPPSTAGTRPSTRSPSRLPTSALSGVNHQASLCAHHRHCLQRRASPRACPVRICLHPSTTTRSGPWWVSRRCPSTVRSSTLSPRIGSVGPLTPGVPVGHRRAQSRGTQQCWQSWAQIRRGLCLGSSATTRRSAAQRSGRLASATCWSKSTRTALLRRGCTGPSSNRQRARRERALLCGSPSR